MNFCHKYVLFHKCLWPGQHVERLTSQVTSLGEQSRRHTELYETAVRRGRQTESDLHSLSTRCRQLEADQGAAEASREHLIITKEKVSVFQSVCICFDISLRFIPLCSVHSYL